VRARKVAGALTAVGTGALFLHTLPGIVAWRSARSSLFPRLAGIGRPEHVALTFDDGPDPVSTPPILEELERLGWSATFFCLGSQVRRSPGLARELVDRGHEVAVHGDNHRSHLLRPVPWTLTDIRRATDTIEQATGVQPTWFRPPYGGVSASSILAGRRLGLQMILWTTWGVDWREDSTGVSVSRTVARTFRPGATVLLHDSDITSAAGSWRSTLDSLPLLAEQWSEAGLSVGPLWQHGVVGSAIGSD
jgi:peptidoglycan/xylan/chitin deacetylase (PgdA/CDA1 family)